MGKKVIVEEPKKEVKERKSSQDKQVKKTKAIKKTKANKNTAHAKKNLTRRFNKLKVKPDSKHGTVYVGHLPKGFNEEELKKFFSQFGNITKYRVSRSTKTGRSRGYAYLEFGSKEVADIAAKTMNGYIMFGKQLDCHLVEEPHRETFKNGNRKWKFIPTQIKFRNEKNAEKTEEEKAARVKGLLQKEKEKRDRLKELGIKYDFPGYSGIVEQVKKTMKEQIKEQIKTQESGKKKEEVKQQSGGADKKDKKKNK